jgi:DNA-binding MarR family transcriptional regulator
MSLDQTTTPLDNRAAARSGRIPPTNNDTVDLGPLEALIGFQIHLLDLLMYQAYYERLGRAVMTPGMFSTLCAIEANPGVRQGVLADALLIQRPNMTLLVNRLIRAGYVRRRAARSDNRGVELFLRAEGERALRDVASRLAAHERGLTVALTAAERERLAILLTKMVRGLREKPQPNGGERRKTRVKAAMPRA